MLPLPSIHCQPSIPRTSTYLEDRCTRNNALKHAVSNWRVACSSPSLLLYSWVDQKDPHQSPSRPITPRAAAASPSRDMALRRGGVERGGRERTERGRRVGTCYDVVD